MNWDLNQEENHIVDGLDLSLYLGIPPPPPPQQRLQPPMQLPSTVQPAVGQRQQRRRRNIIPGPPPPPQALPTIRSRRRPRTEPPRPGFNPIIPAPFPWATTRRASIYSLEELRTQHIFTISNQVQCKKCDRNFELVYNLQEKYSQLESFIRAELANMRDRAHPKWVDPVLASCEFCGGENCVKPIVSSKKRAINWLFLLLGQMLGCLTLDQLKYFCKHRNEHRTGAKDRLLCAVYLKLFYQLRGNDEPLV